MADGRKRLREAFGQALAKTASDADELDPCGPPVCIIRNPYMKGVRIELRPISVAPPPSAAVRIMYRRDGNKLRQAGVGSFKDGHWTNGKGKSLAGDLYWTAMVHDG